MGSLAQKSQAQKKNKKSKRKKGPTAWAKQNNKERAEKENEGHDIVQ